MKFENIEVWGFEHALRGMRNPKESWEKSDSGFEIDNSTIPSRQRFNIGKNDLKLAQTLIKAGSSHRKFLRQIFASVDITAPLYWWKEFDTYKVGTVANSTSTMHKLASTPITRECFEMDDFENIVDNDITLSAIWFSLICDLEGLRKKYNETKEGLNNSNLTESEKKHINSVAKHYWKELIRLLPESWLQKRTVTMNYENILNMVRQRENHKLSEWSKYFIEWAGKLPYSNELIFIKENINDR